jgi:hypothetical protein
LYWIQRAEAAKTPRNQHEDGNSLKSRKNSQQRIAEIKISLYLKQIKANYRHDKSPLVENFGGFSFNTGYWSPICIISTCFLKDLTIRLFS